MQLSLATNFDDALIDGVRGLPVAELFGKLGRDVLGGNRASYMLDPIGRRDFERHVRRAREAGLGFNYVLNATCLGNIETTRGGQRRIRALLDRLCAAGVTAVTVSSPFLLRTLKRRYPTLGTRVSILAGVDGVRKARFWEDAGADVILLQSQAVNRDFPALRRIREGVSCGLELLANHDCMMDCPWVGAHANLMSHASQEGHSSGGFLIDHRLLACRRRKLQDPAAWLMLDWIRPEDLRFYEALGYDRFKLGERQIPTSELLRRARAYAARRFEGNLLELFRPDVPRRGKDTLWTALWKRRFFLRPDKISPLRLRTLKRVADLWRGAAEHVHIDNARLDGFLTPFLERGCRDLRCGVDCRHCHEFAEKAVRVAPAFRAEGLRLHAEIEEAMSDGSFWRWL